MSSYHHGNLRSALVETAVTLAQTRGPEGVVLREVARQTGVSHNAAYRHFADRVALLAAVGEAAMHRLGEAMHAELVRVRVKEPRARAVERLCATGRAYVHFALEQPGLFEVAFAVPAGPTAPEQTSEPEDEDPYSLLGRALDGLVEAGAVTAERREGAEALCWSAVHGFAVLHLHGPLRDLPAPEREASLEQLLAQVVRGLVASPTPTAAG